VTREEAARIHGRVMLKFGFSFTHGALVAFNLIQHRDSAVHQTPTNDALDGAIAELRLFDRMMA